MPSFERALNRTRGLLRGPCPACGHSRSAPLCEECRAKSRICFEAVPQPIAARCYHYLGAYAGLVPREPFQLTPLGNSLRAFKDRGDRYAGRCVSRLFASAFSPYGKAHDFIVPIPADVDRLRQRGFSSAAWLASGLSQSSKLPMLTDLITRMPGRPAQRTLNGTARRANAVGSFAVGPRSLKGYSVILVDDVATTGATLRDAVRCLREAGASRVLCAVLACADQEVIARCPLPTESAGKNDIARAAC